MWPVISLARSYAAPHTPGQPRQEREASEADTDWIQGGRPSRLVTKTPQKRCCAYLVGSSAQAAPPPIVTFGNFHLHCPNKQITNRNQGLRMGYQQGKRAGCSGKKRSQPPTLARSSRAQGSCESRRDEIREAKNQNQKGRRGWEAPRVSYQLRRARFLARAEDILSPLRASFIKRLYRVVHFSGDPVEIARLHTQAQPSIPPK